MLKFDFKFGLAVLEIGYIHANFGKFGCIISLKNKRLACFYGHPVQYVRNVCPIFFFLQKMQNLFYFRIKKEKLRKVSDISRKLYVVEVDRENVNSAKLQSLYMIEKNAYQIRNQLPKILF